MPLTVPLTLPRGAPAAVVAALLPGRSELPGRRRGPAAAPGGTPVLRRPLPGAAACLCGMIQGDYAELTTHLLTILRIHHI